MANRYWVLGSGTWNLTNTVNWSSTSSFAVGGATVPTPNDDVYFDIGSNVGTSPFTVTLGTTATCASLNIIRLDGQLTFNLGTLYANTLTIYGSVNIVNTTSIFYTSVSPSWGPTTSTNFTATNFIKLGFTATSMVSIPIATTVAKISGSANLGEVLVSPILSSASRLPLGSINIGESPLVINVASTSLSLAFTPKYFPTFPDLPITVIEKFGITYSNTITPIPYQFWG